MARQILSPSFSLPSFDILARDQQAAESFTTKKMAYLTKTGWWKWYRAEMMRESRAVNIDSPSQWQSITHGHDPVYPSQGFVITPYDNLPENLKSTTLTPSEVREITKVWLYYLELFNHPERLEYLWQKNEEQFTPPPRTWLSRIGLRFWITKWVGQVISINQLALRTQGAQRARTQRTDRLKHGPFIKLGRQARTVFVGSANPEIWGNAASVASMAMAHCLCGIPRDGFFSMIKRQADFARRVLAWLDKSPVLLSLSSSEKTRLLKQWRHNVMGVLEADPDKALARAQQLYKVGVRTFRIYSPEPGTGPLLTLQQLRALESAQKWEAIEVFVGQVTEVKQAQQLEQAGADGIFIGIGGGGRCTTGVRSDVAIDWPQLVWQLRGAISIPVIVEGGASDHVTASLTVGVSGIGVTRTVGGGTIESSGGWRYYKQKVKANGESHFHWFKPYGGEASARVKSMGGKFGPFGSIPYVEGETTTADMNFDRANKPTLLQALYLLLGDNILGLVFQNVATVEQLQKTAVYSLKIASVEESQIRHTH